MLSINTKIFGALIFTAGLIILQLIFVASPIFAVTCDVESPIRIDNIQRNDAGVAPILRLYNKDKLNSADVIIYFYDSAGNEDTYPARDTFPKNSFSDFDTAYDVRDGFNGYVEIHFTHHDCIAAEVMPDIRAENLGTIKGVVTNEDGELLADVPVTPYIEYENGWLAGDTVRADAVGRYMLTNLYPGNIRLRFGPDIEGYNDQIQFYPDSSIIESASDIVIDASSTNADVNATIRKMTRLSGRAVSRRGGAPDVVIANVYRRKRQGNSFFLDAASSQAWELVSSAEGDFYGKYVVWDLAPGTYRVGFSATGFYHNTFVEYEASYVGQASDIVVTYGESIENIDTVFADSHTNIQPLAVIDRITVKKGNVGSILMDSNQSVLDNDEDANQNTPQDIRDYLDLDETVLTAILVNEPNYGTLTFNADGTFSYQHDGSDNVADSFMYKTSDGVLESEPVEVFIQVFDTQLYVPFMMQ